MSTPKADRPTAEPRKPWPTEAKMAIIFAVAILLFGAVWFVRLRPESEQEQPKQQPTSIATFEECQAAGNPVQLSNPPVCVTPDGQRFIGPR